MGPGACARAADAALAEVARICGVGGALALPLYTQQHTHAEVGRAVRAAVSRRAHTERQRQAAARLEGAALSSGRH